MVVGIATMRERVSSSIKVEVLGILLLLLH